jgi:hypothetical protein
MSEVLISSAFLFAYRQSAGETPAIRWSRLQFRIAGNMPAKNGMQALKDRTRRRIAGVPPAGGCTQPLMSMFLISSAFCLPFGKVQARRPRSGGLACISGSQATCLHAVVLNR